MRRRLGSPSLASLEAPGSGFESGYLSLPGPEEEEEGEGEEEEGEEARLKVDFFRKLGYSAREVEGVLQKHGWAADTNTVLGELVRQGAPGQKEKEKEAGQAKGPEGQRRRRRRKKEEEEEEEEEEESPPGKAPVEGNREGGGGGGGGGGEGQEQEREAGEGAPSPEELRPVVIDGSNVAMSHGDKDVFSCRGILLAVNWFLDRGHMDITVFVPSWRKEHPRPDVPIADQDILFDLERRKIIVFTPSRRVGGKRVVCYDDRFIVKLAYESDGIVVSNDTYRDLQTERPEWKKFIEERLLMYSFVNDKFMPPDDPLGRHGPSLDNFLRKKPLAPEHKKQQCPYGKKCTYGIKCKFYHPERLNQVQRSVADELRANARLSPTRSAPKEERMSHRPPQGESLPPEGSEKLPLQKTLLAEKRSSTRKGRLGDGQPHLPKTVGSIPPMGSPTGKKGSGSSGQYRPPDWYQPPPASPCMDSLACVSQDCLDSGLGSLEGQLSEMWPGGPSAPHSHYSHQEPPAVGSYRGPGPSYQHSFGPESGSYHPYQPQGYHQPLSASSTGFLPYGPELPSGQAPPPHSFSGYSIPADSSMAPMQKYWSEPAYQPAPRAHQDLLRAPQVAYGENPPSCPWPAPDRFAEERAKVHVKLCGIFHPHLVDAVMRRFPHLLDPQQLAAEILTYKSQNPRV